MAKRVLVIGQGGREHALVWKIAQSPQVEKIYAAPGNPGMVSIAECIDISVEDIDSLLKFAKSNAIDLTVVGPEVPLILGIVDEFRKEGLKIFGPTKEAAQLEGSKVFTKNLLKKYNIPTADYQVFTDVASARNYIDNHMTDDKKLVIKADGLAAGKGVVIAASKDEAHQVIDSMLLDKAFGDAGNKIVIEEFLEGEEVSVFAISDGRDYITLISAQDHKRVFDNDEGPNTGGMGAYVNPPIYKDEKLQKEVESKILRPVVDAMRQEGYPFTGVLYAGLMITALGPKVLEFNARFGDPETQAVMPMIASDIVELFEKTCDGKLKDYQVELYDGSCVCVVLASKGYPGNYEKGLPIEGLESVSDDTLIFHAGTAFKDGKLVTNGGRVLSVVCKGQNVKEAIDKVYAQINLVKFDGMHYRRDIGRRAVREV
ncbi:MAG: phosphoribosylamine--glycine ligase [Syntrophomonadaceae bacterium]|nr:phosphoribosylamine--glycine ligase [Syntrophomonadaceae bacterium]